MNAQEELEATQFAMELLMPLEFVKRYLRDATVSLDDDKSVKAMAQWFGVPVGVMTARLWALKSEKAI